VAIAGGLLFLIVVYQSWRRGRRDRKT